MLAVEFMFNASFENESDKMDLFLQSGDLLFYAVLTFCTDGSGAWILNMFNI